MNGLSLHKVNHFWWEDDNIDQMFAEAGLPKVDTVTYSFHIFGNYKEGNSILKPSEVYTALTDVKGLHAVILQNKSLVFSESILWLIAVFILYEEEYGEYKDD